ncbi:MAG: hypothetical protein KAQ94_06075 [Arcobacteraceae bacterium]|nr:hypothetical protein [Arcobacteraceae bacterium]
MNKEKDTDLVKFNKLFTKQELLTDIWLDNERLYNSKHTKEQFKKLKKKKRSKVFVPAIRNTTNIIKAIFSTAFFGAGNPIELKPLGEDESELWTARNKVLNYYYNKLKPNKELNKAFLSALLFKMGVVITMWDERKQKVVTTNIPITDIAFDDECVNIDDVQAMGYRYHESNRIIRQKIKVGVYNEKGILKKLFNEKDLNNPSKRRLIKVIYMQTNRGYKSKTFIDDVLVRVAKVKNNPFQYGYAFEKLPAIDKEIRKDEILCYGGDIVELLKDLQHEINQKRNLKNDIQEKILNPDVYVGDDADVDPKDLTYGEGKKIRVKGDVNQIKERQVPSEYSLNADLSILAGDVQSAVGVNSIQEGETSASDRRSATALSVVNSNSSMRIEEMIMLIKETLFEHWAKTWVKMVFENADDKIINAVTGKKNPFGKKGNRDAIGYDLVINFGMTLDKEKRINDLLGIYQMTSQNPNINPKIIEGFLKKILDLRVGDDTDLDELFKSVESEVNNVPPTKEEIDKDNLGSGRL